MLSASDRAQIVAAVVAELRAGPISCLTDLVETEFACGPLLMNFERREVRVAGAPVRLKPREYDVLAALAANVDRTLSREQLLELCWPEPLAIDTLRVVDVIICRLRRKLGPACRDMILTCVGHGYRLFVADAL